MEPKTKKILIIGGSVAVVGTVIYLLTRKKDEDEFIRRPKGAAPFTPGTSPTVPNPNQNLPNRPQTGNVTLSQDTVKWYPSWLPPFTISF